MAEPLKKLGWFSSKGRPGDRTLESQLQGLDRLLEACPGKSVLDIGCAEGLISMHLVDRGSTATHGIEIVAGHIEVANKLRGARACAFEVGDANLWVPRRSYDIVIMLAVLHKLRDPTAAVKRYAEVAREMVVIRMPPYGFTIVDDRSDSVPHDILTAMTSAGWKLDSGSTGPFDEVVGYFVR
jgi:2-polyprenyl-3-methyl-5-hydroxy-6-metoxy-1,4-benzoquinol methylase